MELDKLISEERISFEIDGLDKWDVIEHLVDLVDQSISGCDREQMVRDVFEREEKSSTGIGRGIAIPHARTKGVPTTTVAIGISKGGIDFESEDGMPCHLIFLIIAPEKESTKYLKTLSAVATLCNDNDRVKRLIEARSRGDVISIISEVKLGDH